MALDIDIEDLWTFAIAASASSLRKAAEILHISQPPLTRKIKKLEDRLGVRLFVRHSNGLDLTPEGRRVLEIIQPLLTMRTNIMAELDKLSDCKFGVIGLTTAFEQAAFDPVINFVNSFYKGKMEFDRDSSIQLANGVARGNLLAAWVALPLQINGLSILNLNYAEALMAVIPEQWRNIKAGINMRDLNGMPFFWFSSWRNPFWHGHMEAVFHKIGFKSKFLEEPPGHDVLLARIANGEAFAIMPQSFRAISRKGVRFVPVKDLPPLAMGIVYNDSAGEALARKYLNAAQK